MIQLVSLPPDVITALNISRVEADSSTDRVYTALRGAIMSGSLEAGTKLSANDLAASLGVSRTPIKNALLRLAASGLVESSHNRRAVVAGWSPADIRDTFDLNGHLHGYAARLAAERAATDEIDQLESYLEEGAQAIESGADESVYWEIDREFHDAIVRLSASRPLQTMLEIGVLEVPQTRASAKRDPRRRMKESLDHHREIVRALTQRDASWAQAITLAHFHLAAADVTSEHA